VLELENWAKELGYKKCILESGIRYIEAVKFYQKKGFQRIENYEQYKGKENSICFEKTL
jgi:GNAT superfamily N-acetyltransferase